MSLQRVSRCVMFVVLVYLQAHTEIAAQGLSKTPLYKNGLGEATNLAPLLPNHGFDLKPDAPKARCWPEGGARDCPKLVAKFVVYDDAPGQQIVLCSCDGNGLDALATKFSKVPKFLRRNVKSVTDVPGGQPSAYASDDHIVVLGTPPAYINVLVHESSHTQDKGFSNGSEREITGYDSNGNPVKNALLKAVAKDSCVPDDYANTSIEECYAQDMVVFLYKLLSKKDPQPGTGCMREQLRALRFRRAPGMQDYIKAHTDQPE